MKASGKRICRHNKVSVVLGKGRVIEGMENYLDKR